MTHKSKEYVPARKIPELLPIDRGDLVWLTADLTGLAFAAIRNGEDFSAADLLEGFRLVLTEEGTLVIPSYNHDLPVQASFNIKTTRPVTGSLADAAMDSGLFIRTAHPLHSFLAWGKHSESLAGLHNVSSFGHDSPFAFLLRNRARMVLAGISVEDAFTFVHFVEEEKQVHYRKYHNYKIKYTDARGHETERSYRLYAKKPGWTMDMAKFEGHLRSENLVQEFKVNGVNFITLELEDAYKVLLDGWVENVARFDPLIFAKDMARRILKRK